MPRRARAAGCEDVANARRVKGAIEAGKIKAIIDRRFPLEQAADAHTLMESSVHVGKIILKVI